MGFLAIDPADVRLAVTLTVLVGAVYLFVTEKIAPDLTALLALLALLLCGVLTPQLAFAGFSHPAVVSVAAVVVLSAGIERTGALSFVARRLLAPLGRSEWLLTLAVMLTIGALSAFLNNTAAVAIFIPVVLETCRRTGASPGRILMPMAFAATLGGMCTLMGTSTNLVVHEYARGQGLPGYTMFELGRLGLLVAAVAVVYLLVVGRFLLPRTQVEADELARSDEYLSELVIPEGSSWIGQPVRSSAFARDHDVTLLVLSRKGQALDPERGDLTFAAGDGLRVRGRLADVLTLASRGGIELHRPRDAAGHDAASGATSPASGRANGGPDTGTRLAEIVILPGNELVGRTLKAARFADVHDALVVALRRRGRAFGRPSTTPLRTGDVLVVEGANEALVHLSQQPGFLVVGTPTPPDVKHDKVVVAVGTLVAVVACVALGWMSIVAAATAGCAVLVLSGCLSLRQAYEALDLSVVFLLAGAMALGAALETSGVPGHLATWLSGFGAGENPLFVIAGFYVASVVLSEFMSNSGAATLLCPVAVTVAERLGLEPMSLLAAITFGCSAAFAMPIGYQTSLMIYGPGGYRFRDFVRVGLVLDVIVAIVVLTSIARFWPPLPPAP